MTTSVSSSSLRELQLFNRLLTLGSSALWKRAVAPAHGQHVLRIGTFTSCLPERTAQFLPQHLLIAAFVARVPLEFELCRMCTTLQWSLRSPEDVDLVIAARDNFHVCSLPLSSLTELYFVLGTRDSGTFESRVPAADWNIVGPEVFDA